MSNDGNPGCIKVLGWIAVLLFVSVLFTAFIDQLDGVLSLFPGWIWTIIIIAGIFVYAKLTEKNSKGDKT